MRRASSEVIVWIAMAEAEWKHGGPRTLTSTDIWHLLNGAITTSTINRSLRMLKHMGIVRVIPGRPNGYRCWQLDGPGRAKYGLPSQHAQ